jgi:hypothetical protein
MTDNRQRRSSLARIRDKLAAPDAERVTEPAPAADPLTEPSRPAAPTCSARNTGCACLSRS